MSTGPDHKKEIRYYVAGEYRTLEEIEKLYTEVINDRHRLIIQNKELKDENHKLKNLFRVEKLIDLDKEQSNTIIIFFESNCYEVFCYREEEKLFINRDDESIEQWLEGLNHRRNYYAKLPPIKKDELFYLALPTAERVKKEVYGVGHDNYPEDKEAFRALVWLCASNLEDEQQSEVNDE